MGIILQRVTPDVIYETVIETWEGVDATPEQMIALLKHNSRLAMDLMNHAEAHGLVSRRNPMKTYLDSHPLFARINVDTLTVRERKLA